MHPWGPTLLLLLTGTSVGRPLVPAPMADALSAPGVVYTQDPAEYYRRGADLISEGDVEQALVTWENAWDELAVEDLHDPRIGAAYVDVVVARGDSARFDTAGEIFLWGLGAPLVQGARPALEAELARTRALLGPEAARRWEALEDSSDARLALELKRFWLEADPTPSSGANERLMEHWGRIIEARERFDRNRRSPIGTDDRGMIFLKFGEPDRVARGSLGATELELQIRIPQDREARQRIRQYDTNPQYEVWVYDDLNEQGFTYFLFGNVDGSGPFELVDGVHELIPYQARSRASARWTPTGMPVSQYLELFYYSELSKLGGHFARRFQEMDQLWNEYTYRLDPSGAGGAPSEFEAEALTQRYQQEDQYFPPTPPTVPVLSEVEDRPRDELTAQFIRLLSDDGVPLLATVGAAAPRIGLDRRGIAAATLAIPGWVMRHTLVIRDENLDEVGRLVQRIRPARADLSNFVIRHVPEPLHLTLTARTLVENEEMADTLIFTDRLPGRAHFQSGEPLDTRAEQFEVSDILTGTMLPPQIDGSALPYPLLPARRIWIQDPLRIYMEFYRAGGGPDGRAILDTRVRLRPLDEDGQLVADARPLTLEVQLNPRAGRPYREFFDMQLRDQDPGRYRLEVEVTDQVRGQQVVRTADLTLVR